MTDRVFLCECCGGTFRQDPTRSDADALTDARRLWPEEPVANMAVLCGDCAQAFYLWYRQQPRGRRRPD